MAILRPLFSVLILVLLSACASMTGSDAKVLVKTDDFLVVKAGSSDSFQSLAQRFLGSQDRAFEIQAANDVSGSGVRSSVLSIPLKPFNASGVFPDGYQLVPILCYHQFREGDENDVPMQVSANAFEAQMAYLAQNGFQVIPLSHLAGFLNGERMLPPKSVVITIDDGYSSVYQSAFPILKKYGFPATLFLYTDFVGGGAALSWSRVRELQDSGLIEVQSHSRSHASLVRKSGESTADYQRRINNEIQFPEKQIRRRLNKEVQHYAYPFGDTSEWVINTLLKNDYKLAVTVQRGSNAAFAPSHLLKRNMIYASDNIDTFRRQLKVFQKVNLK